MPPLNLGEDALKIDLSFYVRKKVQAKKVQSVSYEETKRIRKPRRVPNEKNK